MGYGIKFLVESDNALFSRPEHLPNNVTYDVPTPSSMAGLLTNIYNHPGIQYHIDKIVVYNEPKHSKICRNEVTEKVCISNVNIQENSEIDQLSLSRDEIATQCQSVFLENVNYGIEAHFSFCNETEDSMTEENIYNILLRRLKKGQAFQQPYLGCLEFPAKVTWADTLPKSCLKGDVDLGNMLHHLQYTKNEVKMGRPSGTVAPKFYHPHMVDGVIDVTKYKYTEKG